MATGKVGQSVETTGGGCKRYGGRERERRRGRESEIGEKVYNIATWYNNNNLNSEWRGR